MTLKNIIATVGTLFAITALSSSWADQASEIEVVRDGFMGGCVAGEVDNQEVMAGCECMYNALLKDYGEQGFIDLAKKMSDPDAPLDEELIFNIQKAAIACAE